MPTSKTYPKAPKPRPSRPHGPRGLDDYDDTDEQLAEYYRRREKKYNEDDQ